MTALSIRKVSHAFGRAKVLQDVSFAVPEGSFTALLGANGAGKTTLFNLITRLFDTKAGEIAVCGHDLRRETGKALAALGAVFQERALDANLTVAQNLRYAAALYGIGTRQAGERAEALAGGLGLTAQMGRKVRQLSGGQARRAEIARALMHRPRLLLCDEASAGLDIEARRGLVAEAHRLAAEDGTGVLWATHLTDEIHAEDAVVVLHKGRVLAQGSAAEIGGEAGLEAAFLRLTRKSAA